MAETMQGTMTAAASEGAISTRAQNDLWAFTPSLGNAGDCEPSLQGIIYRHYRAHFDHDDARIFTNQYMAQFSPQFATAPDMLAALKSLLEMPSACTSDAEVVENNSRREIARAVIARATGGES